MRSGSSQPAVIFDVEGTLVDCVPPTLPRWSETFADFGLTFSVQQLQPYSGMDGGEMIEMLLRGSKAVQLKPQILKEQGERYREKFLSNVKPFDGIKPLFQDIKDYGWRIG